MLTLLTKSHIDLSRVEPRVSIMLAATNLITACETFSLVLIVTAVKVLDKLWKPGEGDGFYLPAH